jgi:pimeloyl-ACP methyl ester carboxylesterase
MDLDGPNVNPVCRTRLYTHGRRTDRSLLLLHGFTNCPQQFDELGKRFFEMGWNVLIPRYPRHGYTDRLNTSIAELRSEHLVALANQAARAAAGLGKRVTVAGLSLGGILAAHIAQTQDGIERSVLVAPLFGIKRVPGPVQPVLARMAQVIPNFYVWWDYGLKEHLAPTYGYPRFSTHAYAALFETAMTVTRAAREAPPKARSLAVVTNAADPGLDNRYTYRLVQEWRDHGAIVETFEFAGSDGLPHDLIDPANPQQNVGLVYPVVMRLIRNEE